MLRHPASRAVLAWLVGTYLAFALRTTRWTLEGRDNLAPHASGAPAIMAAWHERVVLTPALWRMIRRWPRASEARPRVRVLISRSRDGRFIAAIIRHFGVDVTLGSSSRGGVDAVRQLVGALAEGWHVGITPDGPRGPRRRAAAGVAQLAALSGAPVLPCAAQTANGWTLRSWDRMVIPRPFGRGVVVCGPPIHVPRSDWRAGIARIETALTAAADTADRLCAPGRSRTGSRAGVS